MASKADATKPAGSLWHLLAAAEAARQLGTGIDGLSNEEAAQRLARYGRNELRESRRRVHLRRGGNREVDDAQGLAPSRGRCREAGIRADVNAAVPRGAACLLHA